MDEPLLGASQENNSGAADEIDRCARHPKDFQ